MIETYKQILFVSSQWESQKDRFGSISFGKIQFLPPCICDLLFMSYRLCRISNSDLLNVSSPGCLPLLWSRRQPNRKHILNSVLWRAEICKNALKYIQKNAQMYDILYRFAISSFSFEYFTSRCFRFIIYCIIKLIMSLYFKITGANLCTVCSWSL
jgi:hypothetical protein